MKNEIGRREFLKVSALFGAGLLIPHKEGESPVP